MDGRVEMTDEYEKMIAADLAQHKEIDNCDYPLKCPNGCGLAFWDMGLEGHYCSALQANPHRRWNDDVRCVR